MLQKASNTKEKNEEGEILEKIKLAYADYQAGQYSNNNYTYELALKNIFGKDNIESCTEKKEKYIIKIKDNNTQYYFDRNTGKSGEYTYIDPFNYETKTKATVAPGDDITLGTERFKVFSVTDMEIKAMPYKQIELSENSPVQNATDYSLKFATRAYWKRDENGNIIPEWDAKAIDNVLDVDMNNKANNIQKYITAYKKTLESFGAEEIDVRVAKYSDVSNSNITNVMRYPGGTGRIWLGSVRVDTSEVYYILPGGNIGYGNISDNTAAVRPILIIY